MNSGRPIIGVYGRILDGEERVQTPNFSLNPNMRHIVVKTGILYKLQDLCMAYRKMIHVRGEDFLFLGKMELLQGFFPEKVYEKIKDLR